MVGADLETRILDAAKHCCEQWGVAKVTIDDIAASSGTSRATIYRLFPGGKDVLFEALRLRELEEFFGRLMAAIGGIDNLEDLLVAAVVHSATDLRSDEHLALMMASAPGELVTDLTVEGLRASCVWPPCSSRRWWRPTWIEPTPPTWSKCWSGS